MVIDRLRALPSVDRLATAVARAELAERRAELLAGADDEVDLVARARERLKPSLRPVLNATGVIVHTNLGRAPLAGAARAAVAEAARGYVEPRARPRQRRAARRARTHVDAVLCELTGAEAALRSSTTARAAVLLAVAALAGRRGDRLARAADRDRRRLPHARGRGRQAGARLVEVADDQHARAAADYEAAAGEATASDPARPPVQLPHTAASSRRWRSTELCTARPAGDRRRRLGRARRRASSCSAGEPPVRRSACAPAPTLVAFSGDKLLGGPQAGLHRRRGAPRSTACRQHPLARAVRHRQALARGAGGDARAAPPSRARRSARSPCSPC